MVRSLSTLSLFVLVACKSSPSDPLAAIRLEPTTLPGFSVDLVPSHEKTDPWTANANDPLASLRYTFGQLKANAPVADGHISGLISWEPGDLWGKTGLEDLRQAADADIEHPVDLAVADMHTLTVRGRVGGHPTLITAIKCGHRRVEIWTGSDLLQLEPFHNRIVRSFRCQPDPVTDRQLAALEKIDTAIQSGTKARIDLTDHADWKLNPKDNGRFLLVSSTGALLSVMPFVDEPSESDLQLVLGAQSIKLGSGSLRSVEVPANSLHGWLRVVNCGLDRWQVVMYLQGGGPAEDGREIVEGAHCLAAGAPDPAWPKT